MDALPMSEATGGTRYRAIGGLPTRRHAEGEALRHETDARGLVVRGRLCPLAG